MTITPAQGSPELSLGTFDANGLAVTAAPPVLKLPGGGGQTVFTSAGQGVWASTGPDTAILTFIVPLADGQGNAFGTNTVRSNIELGADGQTFSGDFVWTIADPSGNTMITMPGTVEAVRIVAEAPVMPAGTPTIATPTG